MASFSDGGKLPCVLIENKVDLLKDDPNENELNEFAKNNEFSRCYFTSAKTGLNISKSIKFLIKNIIKRMGDGENVNEIFY